MSDNAVILVDDAPCHGSHRELFAYIAIDKVGKSAICATGVNGQIFPMVGMMRQDMKKWRDDAAMLRQETDKSVILIRYQFDEVVDE